jgi:lysozyme
MGRRFREQLMREINEHGLTLIKRFEGIEDGNPATVNLDPYLDPLGIWTIGWGHAIRDVKGKYLRGRCGEAGRVRALSGRASRFGQAEALLLLADTLEASKNVGALVSRDVALTDNQFSALVSFEFNTGALRTSTLLLLLNAGKLAEAALQFGRWTKARDGAGKLVPLAGLVTRRDAERKLFLSA